MGEYWGVKHVVAYDEAHSLRLGAAFFFSFHHLEPSPPLSHKDDFHKDESDPSYPASCLTGQVQRSSPELLWCVGKRERECCSQLDSMAYVAFRVTPPDTQSVVALIRAAEEANSPAIAQLFPVTMEQVRVV